MVACETPRTRDRRTDSACGGLDQRSARTTDDDALAAVRLLILGGEACPEHLVERLAEGRELWNTYGPTEATVVSTAMPTVGWMP